MYSLGFLFVEGDMIHSFFSGMNLHQLPIQIFSYIVSETLESYTSTLAGVFLVP